jgi:hypothetical protein
VLWFDTASGGYVSSTCYGSRLPGWALGFNERLRSDFAGRDWTLSAPAAMLAA